MPSTRSQAGAEGDAEVPEVSGLLEEAAAELSAESAARKAAEERVKALEAQLEAARGGAAGGDPFATPLPPSDGEDDALTHHEEDVKDVACYFSITKRRRRVAPHPLLFAKAKTGNEIRSLMRARWVGLRFASFPAFSLHSLRSSPLGDLCEAALSD